jgi:3'(2'), 5'-bisphosphate nucleotidase
LEFSKLLQNRAALCNMVRRLAIEAGDITLQYFDEAGFHGTEHKQDGSPVTQADREAEVLIEKGLLNLLPDVPVVGEEAIAAGHTPDISGSEYFWLVDPLDGTREFISGSGDYTVNIALIHHGEPVLGVVYAPALGDLYAGFVEADGGKAVRWNADSDKEKEIYVRTPPKAGLTVVASRSHGTKAEQMEKFLEDYKVEKLLKRGSSLKICIIAAGKADLYPRLGTTSEWDTAAGDAVLRAAGGKIVDLEGNPLRYGKAAAKFLNPHFVASAA